MVTITRRVVRMPLAPVAAVMFGVAAAILVAAVPISMFESAVMSTGLPQALSIAEPPLGLKARILAIVVVSLGMAALSWLVITPIERWADRDRRRRRPWADDGYARADADSAPVDRARKPIFAPEELGAPLMSDAALASAAAVEAEVYPVADTPEAAPEPLFVEADSELEAPIAEEELLLVEPAAAPVAAPEPWTPTTVVDGETSIHALIRRLEAGLAKRGGTDPDPGTPAAAAPLSLADEWIVGDPPKVTTRRDDDETAAALATLKRFAWR
jgi:hypothetical protein